MKWGSILVAFVVYSLAYLATSVVAGKPHFSSKSSGLKSFKSSRLFSSRNSETPQAIHHCNSNQQKDNYQFLAQMTVENKPSTGVQIPQGLKLLIGAGGIYASFLYYGTLQEDVFHYKAADGSMFKQAWFLQALGEKCSLF